MPKAEECRYTKDHEWVWKDGDAVRIGVTDFAQGELGDIVYVELKDPGTQVSAGDEIGTIESVKAVAEVYAPVSGTIASRNDALGDKPETINDDPLGDGWLVTMTPEDAADVDALMDHAGYAAFLEEEAP